MVVPVSRKDLKNFLWKLHWAMGMPLTFRDLLLYVLGLDLLRRTITTSQVLITLDQLLRDNAQIHKRNFILKLAKFCLVGRSAPTPQFFCPGWNIKAMMAAA